MLGVHSKAVRPAASTGRPITRIPAFQGVGDPFAPLAAPPAAQSAHFDSIALRAESETGSAPRGGALEPASTAAARQRLVWALAAAAAALSMATLAVYCAALAACSRLGGLSAGAAPLELLWADEFDGPGINLTSWSFQLGDGSQYGVPGWGNGELQWYTSAPANARVAGGALLLTALRNDSGRAFTSARLRTAGLRDFVPAGPQQLLRFEARVRLPQGGDGIWPALWMLPTPAGQQAAGAWPGAAADVPSGLAYGPWPASGEIDIVEAVNAQASVFGTAHFDDYQTQGGALDASAVAGGFAGAWHVFSLEWTLESLAWAVDGAPMAAARPRCNAPGGWYTNAAAAAGDCAAPFDQPFHLLVNLAIGGRLPGVAPGPDTPFPQTLAIDYVRVYTQAYTPGSSLGSRRRRRRRLQ